MQYTVEEAVKDLLEEKQEIENRISLIQSIDWNKPVTEDVWHEICETPIRGTDLLKILVTNIFPEAEEIKVGANYVNFKLRGFDIQIPTSRCRGINIGTNWYKDPNTVCIEPRAHSETTTYMKMYFDAVDNKEGWKNKSAQEAAVIHSSGNTTTEAPCDEACSAAAISSDVLYSTSATRTRGTAAANL